MIGVNNKIYNIALKDNRLYYYLSHNDINNGLKYEKGQFISIYGLIFQLLGDLTIKSIKQFNFEICQGWYNITCTSIIYILNLEAIGI